MKNQAKFHRSTHNDSANSSEPIRRHAASIIGMMLDQAFVTTKSAGFKLHVSMLDGIVVAPHKRDDELYVHIDVDVLRGLVTKAKLS